MANQKRNHFTVLPKALDPITGDVINFCYHNLEFPAICRVAMSMGQETI
jgi:hypothetical protein